eukprot:m.360091 g.360091  ORF g.360091 m.360091 type:complete len:331 (+) comp18882_c0_seq1:369-1361(+)
MPAQVEGFNPNKPRYEQDRFVGRLRHFLDVADPRCLMPGAFFGMPLEKSKALMEQYETNTLPTSVNADTMWLAKKVYDSSIHPDTGETILPPFRMCGFAVFGTPIVVGMLLPNPTIVSTIFWQSINQTHNAAVNYSNRNASQPVGVSDIAVGYAGAVASSVGIAVGLNQAVKRAKISEPVRRVLSRFVPYPAVAAASTANMLLMRRTELKQGISVKDHEGKTHGVSTHAAKKAIFQTMMTRLVLPAPLLIIPPVAMMMLEKTPIFKRFPRTRMPIETLVCVGAFVFGLPFAIALFPQEGTIAASEMEPQYQNLKDAQGNAIDTFYFNKGL